MAKLQEITDDPVIVPRNDKPLATIPPWRVEALEQHLTLVLGEMLVVNRLDHMSTPVRSPPTGFQGVVANCACSLCKGFCCGSGQEDAFLDQRTLARVLLSDPDLSDRGLIQRYLDRVPSVSFDGSCIFHGATGCTLDRSMRSDVCNSYYCWGLSEFMTREEASPTVVIAGEGEKMRTSPILRPSSG